MKHTKKMILVPEMEYLSLMNMLKNRDEVGYEKSKIDSKIQQTLTDASLNPSIAGKRYDLLVKQQHKLKNDIASDANRSQNVKFDTEQMQHILSGLSKYLGVAPTQPQTTHDDDDDEVFQKESKIKKRIQSTPAHATLSNQILPQKENKEEEEDNEELQTTTTKRNIPKRESSVKPEAEQPETSSKTNYIIHPDYFDNMSKILRQNRDKLKINKIGKLMDPKNKPIEDTNVADILKYLTGKIKIKPIGTDLLLKRMKDEVYFKKALEWADYHRQRGEGSPFKLQLYKTLGLLRATKPKKTQTFKPQIWAKL